MTINKKKKKWSASIRIVGTAIFDWVFDKYSSSITTVEYSITNGKYLANSQVVESPNFRVF